MPNDWKSISELIQYVTLYNLTTCIKSWCRVFKKAILNKFWPYLKFFFTEHRQFCLLVRFEMIIHETVLHLLQLPEAYASLQYVKRDKQNHQRKNNDNKKIKIRLINKKKITRKTYKQKTYTYFQDIFIYAF